MAPSLPGSPVPESLVADALSTGHPTPTIAVSGEQSHACALQPGGILKCWGNNRYGQLDGPDGTFTRISTTCWTPPGAVDSRDCWGISESGQLGPDSTFTAISAGRDFSCAIKTDGTIDCWGNNQHRTCQQGTDGWACTDVRLTQLDAPEGTFSAISAGNAHTCGIRSDGTIACWGTKFKYPAQGRFTHIAQSLHWIHSYAINADEGVEYVGLLR